MEDELDRAEGSPKITEFRCPECDRELTREEVEQIFNVKLLDRYFENSPTSVVFPDPAKPMT